MKVIYWLLKIVIAGFVIQTVFGYKYPAHPESVELFTEFSDYIGNVFSEKFLRISTGTVELLASILLLIPKTTKVGASLMILTMMGAIVSHIIFISNDVPLLYIAIAILLGCLVIIYLHKKIYK